MKDEIKDSKRTSASIINDYMVIPVNEQQPDGTENIALDLQPQSSNNNNNASIHYLEVPMPRNQSNLNIKSKPKDLNGFFAELYKYHIFIPFINLVLISLSFLSKFDVIGYNCEYKGLHVIYPVWYDLILFFPNLLVTLYILDRRGSSKNITLIVFFSLYGLTLFYNLFYNQKIVEYKIKK